MVENYLTRKEKITISSIQILDEMGIKGLTTREIAKRQHISEPAIYRHFENKKKIIFSIIEKFLIFDELVINTIKENNMLPLEGIMYYLESFSKYYENYPEITTIMFSFDVYRYDDELKKEMLKSFNHRDSLIIELITEGQESGKINKNLSPAFYWEILIDTLWGSIKKWKLNDCKENLTEITMAKLTWLIDAMKKERN